MNLTDVSDVFKIESSIHCNDRTIVKDEKDQQTRAFCHPPKAPLTLIISLF